MGNTSGLSGEDATRRGDDAVVLRRPLKFGGDLLQNLLAALKDDETSGLYVFTHEGQRVFSRHGSPPVPLVPLILDHNVRNTRQIANAFQPLVDHPMRFLGGEAPAVTFVACSRDDAMNVGDDQIEALLEEGWRPEDLHIFVIGPLVTCRPGMSAVASISVALSRRPVSWKMLTSGGACLPVRSAATGLPAEENASWLDVNRVLLPEIQIHQVTC